MTCPGAIARIGATATIIDIGIVTNESAQVAWRFRGLDGKELRGKQAVREKNGARPKELVIDQAFFSAGPYSLRWSPAEVTMTGTREKPESVVSATSRVYYPPDVKASNVATTSFEEEDLAAACR